MKRKEETGNLTNLWNLMPHFLVLDRHERKNCNTKREDNREKDLQEDDSYHVEGDMKIVTVALSSGEEDQGYGRCSRWTGHLMQRPLSLTFETFLSDFSSFL